MRRRLLTDEDGQVMRMYCVACKSWVIPAVRDHGIGYYEYWGSRGTHHDYRTECPECDSEELLNHEPIEEPEELTEGD